MAKGVLDYPVLSTPALEDIIAILDMSESAGSRSKRSTLEALRQLFGSEPIPVAQTAHGFSVGDLLRHDGTDFVEATADTESNAVVVGIVTAVGDVDSFEFRTSGYVQGLSGLTGGSVHYLQDAGGLGPSEGTVKVPVALALTATTAVLLAIGAAAGGGLEAGDDADQLGSGAATDGQVLTADGSGGAAWEDATGGGTAPTGEFIATRNSSTLAIHQLQNPAAVYDSTADKTFVTYAGDGRKPYAMYFDHSTGRWSEPVEVHATNPLVAGSTTERAEDDHGAPALMIDGNGYLHILFGSHNTDLYWAKSDAARDVSAWTVTQLTVISENSYPSVTYDSTTSKIWAVFRAGNTESGAYPSHQWGGLISLADGGGSWAEVVGGIVDLTGSASSVCDFYPSDLEVNPANDRLGITFFIAEGATHSGATRKNIYYVEYDPSDGHLYSMDGTDLGTTLTYAELSSVVVRTQDDAHTPKLAYGSGGKIYISWVEHDSANSEADHYVGYYPGSGSSWTVTNTGATAKSWWHHNDIRVLGDGSLELLALTGGKSGAGNDVEYAYRGGGLEVWSGDAANTTWSRNSTVISQKRASGHGLYSVQYVHDGQDDLIALASVGGQPYVFNAPLYAYGQNAQATVQTQPVQLYHPVFENNVVSTMSPATSFTEIDLSSYLPSNATIVRIVAQVYVSSANTDWVLSVRGDDANTGIAQAQAAMVPGAAGSESSRVALDVPITDSLKIEYITAGMSQIAIDVLGYWTH